MSTTAFADAMRCAGLEPPNIVADGQFRRFSANGKRGDDSGWYALYADGIPVGAFGDLRSGLDVKWRAKEDREFSKEERRAYALAEAGCLTLLRTRQGDLLLNTRQGYIKSCQLVPQQRTKSTADQLRHGRIVLDFMRSCGVDFRLKHDGVEVIAEDGVEWYCVAVLATGDMTIAMVKAIKRCQYEILQLLLIEEGQKEQQT